MQTWGTYLSTLTLTDIIGASNDILYLWARHCFGTISLCSVMDFVILDLPMTLVYLYKCGNLEGKNEGITIDNIL